MERNPWTITSFSTLFEHFLTLKPCGGGLMYLVHALVSFIKGLNDVVDITHIFPQNANFFIVTHAMRKKNKFLLMQWIYDFISLP